VRGKYHSDKKKSPVRQDPNGRWNKGGGLRRKIFNQKSRKKQGEKNKYSDIIGQQVSGADQKTRRRRGDDNSSNRGGEGKSEKNIHAGTKST